MFGVGRPLEYSTAGTNNYGSLVNSNSNSNSGGEKAIWLDTSGCHSLFLEL